MFAEISVKPAPTSCIPPDTMTSLLDLAQQAFTKGYAEIGERLIDLVHESFSRP